MMRIRSTITAAALAVIAVACTVGCGAAADATAPATTVTRDPATTPTTIKRAATTTTAAPRDPEREFDNYVRASAPTYTVELARKLSLLTCQLLADGTSPEEAITALVAAASDNGRDLAETGRVVYVGMVTYCPDRVDEYVATAERMVN